MSEGFAEPTLRLSVAQFEQIVGHCYEGLPHEACGLLGGPVRADGTPVGSVTSVYPCRNADASARTYTVDSRDHIKALRDAEARGGDLVGAFHSHTHSEAYPSSTDVMQAVEPGWLYVLVSLREHEPVLRAFRILGTDPDEDVIVEVPVDVLR